MKGEVKGLDRKVDNFEAKFSDELRQAKSNKSASSNEGSSTKTNQADYEHKILSLEMQLDEVHQAQRDLGSDIGIQKAQLESFKTTSAITMNDLKANQSEVQDVRLRRLEQVVDQLTKNVETIKTNVQFSESTNSTKFSENGSFNERMIPKHEALSTFGYPPPVHTNAFSDSYLKDTTNVEFSSKNDPTSHLNQNVSQSLRSKVNIEPVSLSPSDLVAAQTDKFSKEVTYKSEFTFKC